MNEKDRYLRGTFELKDGKIQLIISNKNFTFKETESALILLKKELERLLDEKENCPFYKGSKKKTKKGIGKSCTCTSRIK